METTTIEPRTTALLTPGEAARWGRALRQADGIDAFGPAWQAFTAWELRRGAVFESGTARALFALGYRLGWPRR